MEWLSGKKTYIVGALIAVATFFHQMGYIDDSLYQAILGFLGGAGLIALRAGVTKSK